MLLLVQSVTGENFMQEIIHLSEVILHNLVIISTVLLEVIGIIILVYSALKSFLQWIKKDSHLRLNLAEGIALSLEFKMGSEVLRTVIVRDWQELGILGAVILLRGLLSLLIHWEIRNEQAALKEQAPYSDGPV